VAVTATLPKAVDRMVVELFDVRTRVKMLRCIKALTSNMHCLSRIAMGPQTVERVTSPALHRTVPGLRQRFVQISGHHGPKHGTALVHCDITLSFDLRLLIAVGHGMLLWWPGTSATA